MCLLSRGQCVNPVKVEFMSLRAKPRETCGNKYDDDDNGHMHILYEYVGSVIDEVQRRAEINQT